LDSAGRAVESLQQLGVIARTVHKWEEAAGQIVGLDGQMNKIDDAVGIGGLKAGKRSHGRARGEGREKIVGARVNLKCAVLVELEEKIGNGVCGDGVARNQLVKKGAGRLNIGQVPEERLGQWRGGVDAEVVGADEGVRRI